MFVGVDNKNVVDHVSHLLSAKWRGRPFPLVKDGDLLQYLADILHRRGRNTVRVCKVKGHATEGMVARQQVRREALVGNNLADLHRYFIAVARIAVNHDPGHGTAPDPTVWCTGAPAKKAKLEEAVCEFAAAPGPDDLGWSGWSCYPVRPLSNGDFDCWPYSTGLLIKFSTFLGSLHWPSEGGYLVHGWCILHRSSYSL